MSNNVKFYNGNEINLPSSNTKGAFYVTDDTGKMYYDNGDEKHLIGENLDRLNVGNNTILSEGSATIGEQNIAYGKYAFSGGYKSTAGAKAFKIDDEPIPISDGIGQYVLDDVTGITQGMHYLASTSNVHYNPEGTITAIDGDTNTITVDNFVNYPLRRDEDDLEEYNIYNYLLIPDDPTLGTIEVGYYAHSQGHATHAYEKSSHTEGSHTIGLGKNSHVEGFHSIASNFAAHAEGGRGLASGEYSHTEGYGTVARGSRSHAEGESSEAHGAVSHAEGQETKATVAWAHSEGYRTKASGNASHAEGNGTEASGNYSHTEGLNTKASGEKSHAEGHNTKASGTASHTQGWGTNASNSYSHAEGHDTTASGIGAHAEGDTTTASGDYSHAEGFTTSASGKYAHTEGSKTQAIGEWSHAEGSTTQAQGKGAHAEGYKCVAAGNRSHAEGEQTIAGSNYQHVQGKFNVEDTPDTKGNGTYAHIVGGGTSDTDRRNIHTVDWNGNAWFAKDVYVGGTYAYDQNGVLNTDGAKKLATEEWVDELIYSSITSVLETGV